MKQIVAIVLAASLLAGPALARKKGLDDVDFGRISCGEFIDELQTSTEEEIGALLIWLDGYLSGVTGDTVMRPAGLEAFAESLVDRCQRRRRERLLDAARAVGIRR